MCNCALWGSLLKKQVSSKEGNKCIQTGDCICIYCEVLNWFKPKQKEINKPQLSVLSSEQEIHLLAHSNEWVGHEDLGMAVSGQEDPGWMDFKMHMIKYSVLENMAFKGQSEEEKDMNEMLTDSNITEAK